MVTWIDFFFPVVHTPILAPFHLFLNPITHIILSASIDTHIFNQNTNQSWLLPLIEVHLTSLVCCYGVVWCSDLVVCVNRFQEFTYSETHWWTSETTITCLSHLPRLIFLTTVSIFLPEKPPVGSVTGKTPLTF